jgi:hypothetical protein
MTSRHVVLPRRGVALVSTDLHGNFDDFCALRQRFLCERARCPDTHWVQLGDIVHAPDAEARREQPELYDFPDGSMAIVDGWLALAAAHPGHLHFVLGNHDHAHIGGPHTSKFYPDEVAALEATLDDAQRARLHGLFAQALLSVVAPCGALLCHGSPDEHLTDLRRLDALVLPGRGEALSPILQTMLCSYGQPDAVTRRMLAAVSQAGGWDLQVVIHGHDRDESGFFVEGGHQLCPVLFGAPRGNKRFVRLDLSARYDGVWALRDGYEILRLHG